MKHHKTYTIPAHMARAVQLACVLHYRDNEKRRLLNFIFSLPAMYRVTRIEHVVQCSFNDITGKSDCDCVEIDIIA